VTGDQVRGDRSLVVFDVDGVLADVTHRLHHLTSRPKDWSGFFAAAAQDPPLPEGVDLARELAGDHDVVYLTGRPAHLRGVTARWLADHGLPDGPLVMRRARDFRPARLAKLELLRELAGERTVHVVVDDDAEVVQALEGAGFAVLLATWAPPSRQLRQAQERDGRT
jgi:phosphoglycolate phosphatase-like HAD superfamily hydrolase